MKSFKALRTVALAGLLSGGLLLSACSSPGTDAPEDGGDGNADLKVAILTSGAVTDNGYNADAQRAADMIESDFGATVAVSESVPIPNQSDVYRQFATQGYDLVIGWGGQFTDGAVEMAEQFPDVNFFVVNSNVENGANLGSFDQAVEQWSFMAGWLQAKMSESGTIGWIGAQCFPATAAGLHGTEQGAKYANPDVVIRSTFTGDFEDPTKASQAAAAMIESGADNLSGNLNNAWPGVFEASHAAGNVPVITEWVDNSELAPDIIVSSILKSLSPFVSNVVQSQQDGSFDGAFTMYDVPEGWGPILATTPELFPQEFAAEAEEIQQMIINGDIEVERNETCS